MTMPPGLPGKFKPGSRVLLRTDLNVPIESGRITADERIRASLPTIRRLQQARCRVLVMSHLGRPREGQYDAAASLKLVAAALAERLGEPVGFRCDWIDGVKSRPGSVTLLENVRFLKGETGNSDALGRRMAALCDLYVMDAFGSAHRAHASTHAVAQHAPRACAGPLLRRELRMLRRALENPVRPLVAIVGGAKVSTKIEVLERLAEVADELIVGGGIANTFMAAAGLDIGDSLHEPKQLALARRLMTPSSKRRATVPLPQDVVCEIPGSHEPVIREADEVRQGERIMDVGPKTRKHYGRLVKSARTVIWNGPLGVFEDSRFAAGTEALGRAIAASQAFSIAGGGDTLAAVGNFRIKSKMSYLSTGGGAFLEYATGRALPAVEILNTVAS